MRFRIAFLFGIAALLASGVILPAGPTANSRLQGNAVILADGGDPPPPECGIYDICAVQPS
jgi:hypothetical protein